MVGNGRVYLNSSSNSYSLTYYSTENSFMPVSFYCITKSRSGIRGYAKIITALYTNSCDFLVLVQWISFKEGFFRRVSCHVRVWKVFILTNDLIVFLTIDTE